jgi:hypothetical protein
MEDAYKGEPSVREKLSENYMKPVELLFWSFFLAIDSFSKEYFVVIRQVTA